MDTATARAATVIIRADRLADLERVEAAAVAWLHAWESAQTSTAKKRDSRGVRGVQAAGRGHPVGW